MSSLKSVVNTKRIQLNVLIFVIFIPGKERGEEAVGHDYNRVFEIIS